MPLCLKKFLLRLRYHIRVQGFEDLSKDKVLFICNLSAETAPLIVKLILKKAKLIIPRNAVKTPWLQQIYLRMGSLLVPFYEGALSPFRKSRLRRMVAQIGDRHIVIFSRSAKENFLLEELAPKFDRVVHLHIQGVLGDEVLPLLQRRRKVTVHFNPKESFSEESKGARISKNFIPVIDEIKRISKRQAVDLSMDLYEDLGLDSLDVTQLIVFIEHRYHHRVNFDDLRSVQDLLHAAEGKPSSRERISEHKIKRWQENRPEMMFPRTATIPEAFLRTCDRMGSVIALTDPMVMMSYPRLKSLVLGLAESFKQYPDERIGVLVPSSSQWMVVVLALMMCKKIPVLLNWSLGPKHLEEVVEEAELKTVISLELFLEHLNVDLPPAVEEKVICLEDIQAGLTTRHKLKTLKLARKSTEELINYFGLDEISEDAIAVLLFTSGTEKKPKGVPLSHKNILTNEKEALKALGLNSTDIVLGILPPFHIYGFSFGHFTPLLAGIRVVLNPNPLNFAPLGKMIEITQVTVVLTTPTFFQALLGVAGKEQLKSIRWAILGAEKTPDHLFQCGIPILEGYGLTECSPILTMNLPGKPRSGVGYPLEGVEILIEEGEILVRGPNVFRGYWKERENPFIEINGKRWFVTGDIGSFKLDGTLNLLGRKSRTIKIGGELISLSLVENALASQFPGKQFGIIAQEIELVLFTNHSLTTEQANDALREAGLSNLYKIKEIRIISSLPLLPTGKIDYKRLI